MRRATGAVIIAAIGLILVSVLPAIDRAGRTTTIEGFRSARALHVAPDGRLVVTEYGDAGAPEGRVVLVDTSTGSQVVALDDLWQPEAAGIDDVGTVCAIVGGRPGDGPQLHCDNGRRVDLAVDGQPIRPTDLVAVGADWYAASAEPPAVLRISPDGDVRTVVSFATASQFSRSPPLGLTAIEDRDLWIALGSAGVARTSLDEPGELAPFQSVTSGVVHAVVPRQSGIIVLLGDLNGTGGRIAWCCGVHGDQRTVLERLIQPRGLALLADGRLAISAEGRLTLYRVDALPGG